MTQPNWYRGHGLLVQSEIEIPELTPAEAGIPDVTIRLGDDAVEAFGRLTDPPDFDAGLTGSPDGALVHVSDAADFLVPDQTRVIASLHPGGDMGLARLFLVGSVIGLILHMRGHVVLHGAAVLAQGGITVFAGHSGAGKSTLAAHLGAAGYPVLSDDTLAVSPDGAGGFQAWPGTRVFKLWRDAMAKVGEQPNDGDQISKRLDKFYFDNIAPAPDRPAPLRDVILLERGEGPPMLEPLDQLQTMQAINEHAYRPEFVSILGRQTQHFQQTAALTAQLSGWRLTRPWALERFDETLALLDRHWAGGAPNNVRAHP